MMKQATSLFLFALLFLPQERALAFSFDLSASDVQDLSLATLANEAMDESAGVFCSRWGETKDRLATALQKNDDRVLDYLGGIVENLEDRRGVRDAKREGIRSEADQLRSGEYATLEKAAKTDTEKEAVKKYQERVEKALEERRGSIDTIVTEYRSSVDTLVAKRRMAMESARKEFHSSIETALDSVEKDCAAGMNGAVALKKLTVVLAGAQAKLATDKQNANTTEGQIKASAETRKKSAAATILRFQTELKAARAELQSAFAA